MIVSWNGNLETAGFVSLPASDAVFLRGEGVFETILMEKGRACLWDQHYERLSASALKLGWLVGESEVLLSDVRRVTAANQLPTARVRITLGENCLITAEPILACAPTVKAVSVDCPVNERSPLAGIKCTSYAENMILLRASGADEVIRANTRNELCEGCISNVFFVKKGVIHTPAIETGCLPGVMRAEVLRLAQVEEGRWPLEILEDADEIWLSNSIRKLRFVNSFNGKDFGHPSTQFRDLASLLAR